MIEEEGHLTKRPQVSADQMISQLEEKELLLKLQPDPSSPL
jgi:hypothetical protein